MVKSKKITIKFFLNKTVKPIKEKNSLTYSLYMLLTYNRRSTMLKCHYGKYYKDLESVEKIHYPGFLSFEERIVKKTIEHEISKQGAKFDIKGIGEQYEKYCLGIDLLLENQMKSKLWAYIIRQEPFEYSIALDWSNDKVSFSTLYDMAVRLYDDFEKNIPINLQNELETYLIYMKLYQSSFYQYSFPTVIEWLDKSAEEDYRSKLRLIYKKDESRINQSIGLINKLVRSSIEE